LPKSNQICPNLNQFCPSFAQKNFLEDATSSPAPTALALRIKLLNSSFLKNRQPYQKCIFVQRFITLEFPDGCNTYSGPHSTKCLATMWKDVGCSEMGQEYPERSDSKAAFVLFNLNIR